MENLVPITYDKQSKLLKKEYDKVIKRDAKINLQSWGGIAVNKETVRKQLTPERQKYLDKNGNTPPGTTIKFTSEDMIKDNKNEAARYYSSYL
ncbi:hypothetical protein [Tenacibaculum sp. nBUS_03]|uniref:hypothetical protein n=1 Tax=Tenacibaculum sp. nBUS_03 TaxID=3395320 RepID=UPI003EB73335